MTSNTHKLTVTMTALIGLTLGFAAPAALAQPGWVLSHQKISDTEGDFDGILENGDQLGGSAASLGDLDGDGVGDLAVGAPGPYGGNPCGAVWVLFLNTNGTVKGHQKISDTEGDFDGDLDDGDRFGCSAAALGDLDGDGVNDLAVGARYDGDGGYRKGAVWVLFLKKNGTVKRHQKISDTEGGFTGILDDGDEFGISVASLGDLDGDGVTDLAVGAPWDDDGGGGHGAVWVLFLNPKGTVKWHQKISSTEGGFDGFLRVRGNFGNSVASLGDLDGDDVTDLAVGNRADDGGGWMRGAVWVLFLDTDGTVKDHQKISDTYGNFDGKLGNTDRFGWSVASLGDLDGDGVGDLAVGAPPDDDGGNNRGAVWVLFLDTDGTVKSHQKISSTEGGFYGILDDYDWFGTAVASLGDHDGDGVTDLAVGAHWDDDGGNNRGAVWVLFPSDECYWLGADCNDNGVNDACDIADGVSDDYDLNGVPDECEDCIGNGIPDACDADCDTGNCADHPLGCGGSDDYDLNGVPDECDPDCNGNGIPDACDVDCSTGNCADHPLGCGGSADCNANGVPDECDIVWSPLSQWADTVIDFSSQLSPGNWSAAQALGPPDTWSYGDHWTAWCPSSQDGTIEYIVLGYDTPVYATGATIRETWGNGYVIQVDVREVGGEPHTVWTGTDPSEPGEVVEFLVEWPITDFLVDGLKVTITTDATTDWEEMDALQLHGRVENDCNDNNVPDECDVDPNDPDGDGYVSEDCNSNGVPDECDIADGTSQDVNGNGIPDECECVADLDGDGDTDQSDLGVLLSDWGCTGGNCPGDIDGDGETGQSDLGILLADWGCGT